MIKELICRPGIVLEPQNNMQRTPLHLAAQRGHVSICQLLCNSDEVSKDAVDIDENTPLHLASEQGHISCIVFLIKDAQADFTLKNKFGYQAYDIVYNAEVRDIFDKLLEGVGASDNTYGRQAFNGVIHHNDRVTKLKSLMHKFGQVNKHLEQNNHNEKLLVERLEAEEEQKLNADKQEIKIGDDSVKKSDMRWKNKFI